MTFRDCYDFIIFYVFKKKKKKKNEKKAQYFSVNHLTGTLHREKTTCLDRKVDLKGLINLLCPKRDKSSAQLL